LRHVTNSSLDRLQNVIYANAHTLVEPISWNMQVLS